MIHLLVLSAATVPGSLTSNFVALSALIGALLPPLVSVVQQEGWPNLVRSIVGILACLGAAVVAAFAQGKLNLHDWGASALTIFLMTKTTYLSVWKPSGLAGAIESATTFHRGSGRSVNLSNP